MILFFGALLGFLSVAFGAYAEHGLREAVSSEQFRFLMTAVRYNQVHAVMISAIGLAFAAKNELLAVKVLKWSACLFIVGTLLFSVSIYLSVALNMPALVNITPIGGITIMAAWLLLAVSAFRLRNCLK